MTAGRSGAAGERLKVGVIGGGAIAQVAHLPVLKKMRSGRGAGHLRHRSAQGASPGRPVRGEGCLRRHRGAAALRGARCRGHLLAHPPARVPHSGGAVGQSPRPGGEATRDVGHQRAAHPAGGGEARPSGDGGHESPLPSRRADRAQLRSERRAGDHRERSGKLARLPPGAHASWAGGSAGSSRVAERCSTWDCRSWIWDSGWEATPTRPGSAPVSIRSRRTGRWSSPEALSSSVRMECRSLWT